MWKGSGGAGLDHGGLQAKHYGQQQVRPCLRSHFVGGAASSGFCAEAAWIPREVSMVQGKHVDRYG